MTISSPKVDAEFGAISLFRDLSPAELERVKALVRFETFPAATNIMWMEQRGEAVYVILEGTVKVHAAHPHGREVILAVLGPGEIVGELSLVDSLGRSASVMTMEQVTLARVDRKIFWELLRTVPIMTYNLVEIVSRRLRLANTQIQSLIVLDVVARLARQILAFANEYGEMQDDGAVWIPLRLTQEEYGDLVGASRVRVNQVFSEFRKLNYITYDRTRRITVNNSQALEQLSR